MTDKKNKNLEPAGVDELFQKMFKQIEARNNDLINLIEIIHFYETYVYQLKTLMDLGQKFGDLTNDPAAIDKVDFLKKIFTDAENSAERTSESTLYELYQDQNTIRKEGTAKPVFRTDEDRNLEDGCDLISKNKIN